MTLLPAQLQGLVHSLPVNSKQLQTTTQPRFWDRCCAHGRCIRPLQFENSVLWRDVKHIYICAVSQPSIRDMLLDIYIKSDKRNTTW
jgi:hypothetical protein